MDLQTTAIAYICPSCGASVIKDINIFSLSGGLDIPCRCGEKLQMKITPERKVHLTVPCIACPENHTTRLSSASFFNRELFTVQCPYTALDICFIGNHEKVKKALADNKKYLEETFRQQEGEEFEDDVLKEMYDRYDNPMVMNDVLLLIRDFITEHKIECDCNSMDKLAIDIARDHLKLSCAGCGKSREIRALTENDVTYLCEIDKIELK